MEGVGMYVDFLAQALEGWSDERPREELIEYVVACRADMLFLRHSDQVCAFAALASEIAYDRALMTLCAAEGIEVVATRFAHPSSERRRLEQELAARGIELVSIGRQEAGPW
jgi:hypothetical protein